MDYELINQIKDFLRQVAIETNNKDLINKAFSIYEKISINNDKDYIQLNNLSVPKSKAMEWKNVAERGNRILAIKEAKNELNLGLKEAKELIDKIMETKSLFFC